MQYLFVGTHPESLASGRSLVFGDVVDTTSLSEEDAYLADRLIADVASAPAPAAPQKSEATAPEPTTTEAK